MWRSWSRRYRLSPQPVGSPVRMRAERLRSPAAAAGSAAAISCSTGGAGASGGVGALCTDGSATEISGFAVSGGVVSCDVQRGEFLGLHPAPARSPVARLAPRPPECSPMACSCAGSGSTRSIASTGVAGSPRVSLGVSLGWANFGSGARATTGRCWRLPRGPRAAGLPRRARTPVPTSTARSRRTESGSRGAWTRFSAFAGDWEGR